MGAAIAAGRLTLDPEESGESSDFDDERSAAEVNILVGLIGNAVSVGVRNSQLYRRVSTTVVCQMSVSHCMLLLHVRITTWNPQFAR